MGPIHWLDCVPPSHRQPDSYSAGRIRGTGKLFGNDADPYLPDHRCHVGAALLALERSPLALPQLAAAITLMIARNFARHGFAVLHPQVAWVSHNRPSNPSYFSGEFSIQSIVAAALYNLRPALYYAS
jgi:hypothetical protein